MACKSGRAVSKQAASGGNSMLHSTVRRKMRRCFAGLRPRIVSTCLALIACCIANLTGLTASAQPWTLLPAVDGGDSFHAAGYPNPRWAEQPVGAGLHPLPPESQTAEPVEQLRAAGPSGTAWPVAASGDWAASPWGAEHEPEYADFQPAATAGYSVEQYGLWAWQVMPQGLIYRSYLASVKESRFASVWSNDSQLGGIWDAALGGRLGLLRYGTQDAVFPEGWQIDLEGAAQSRLDPDGESTPLLSTDFRIGIPVTYGRGRWQFKTGYYHISAHLGDEFLLMNPLARRLNYTRDSILLGVGWFCTERLRLYVETAYALSANDGAEPWELQYGMDWAPARDTGLRGAPFFAANAHLREEVDFGGHVVLQTGWSWRRNPRGSLFRVGVQYFKGKSEQYEYYDYSEERFGWGMWADF
jgi:hypothetical protein